MRRLLAAFFLLLAAFWSNSANAQSPGILYDNGLACPGYCHDAWQINDGYVVTDSFFVNTSVRVTGFDFWSWEFPNDRVLRVQWSISSDPFGGTIFGSGSALVHDQFLAVNEYGFDIDQVTVTGLDVSLPRGRYWITLQNVVDEQHSPVYWDENSGQGCHSLGCPSTAFENQLGTIPSETFDVRGVHLPGASGQTKAPASPSSVLWVPLLIGLAVSLRPKL